MEGAELVRRIERDKKNMEESGYMEKQQPWLEKNSKRTRVCSWSTPFTILCLWLVYVFILVSWALFMVFNLLMIFDISLFPGNGSSASAGITDQAKAEFLLKLFLENKIELSELEEKNLMQVCNLIV